MINILLVDDHPAVREGTKNMIEQEHDMKVTTASSAPEALDIIRKRQFNLYIFDLYLPDISGLYLTKQLLSFNNGAFVLIITGHDIEPHLNLLIESGASGFIQKTASREQLIIAIRCALRNEAIIPVPLLKQLRRDEAKIISPDGPQLEDISLNKKEQDVLYEASQGKTNKEISQTLYISQRMVEYYLTKIFGKLNVSSRGEAIAKARELKLVPVQKINSL